MTSNSCRFRVLAAMVAVAACANGFSPSAAVAQGELLRPITGFGVNGWVAPGTITYSAGTISSVNVLDTGNSARGMGLNPATGNVIVASRASGTNTVAVIDGNTGTLLKTMDVSSILPNGSPATSLFPVNMVDVNEEGRIFVTNLAGGTTNSFRVYEYASEATVAPPSLVFNVLNPGNGGGNASYRFGDSFAVFGSGASTIFAAAGSSSGTTSPGPNSQISSNFMIGTVDGTGSNSIYRRVAGANTASNDYRLGLTFVDTDTVIGLQGGPAQQTDFVSTGTTGPTAPGVGATITASITTGTAGSFGSNVNMRVLDYVSIAGKDYLASVVADFSGSSNNRVEVYNIVAGSSAVVVATLNNTTAFNSNANATGAIQWGPVTQPDPAAPWYYEARLYTMNTNNGIQGMVFSVPEPSTWAMMATGVGLSCLAGYRRRKRRADASTGAISGPAA